MSLSFSGRVVGTHHVDPNFSVRIKPTDESKGLPLFVDLMFSALPSDLTLGQEVTITLTANQGAPASG